MKHGTSFMFLPLILVFAFSLGFSADIDWQALSGGGISNSINVNYKLSGTVGQSLSGFSSGANNQLTSGFWNKKLSYTDVDDQENPSGLPKEFALFQNYPNPFNPQTNIEYALPKGSQVNLVVYNILGQKIRTLVDEFQNAGMKKVMWDGKDQRGNEIPSGIYFYKLKAENYSQTKKMVILK
jgi:hypothetical protein